MRVVSVQLADHDFEGKRAEQAVAFLIEARHPVSKVEAVWHASDDTGTICYTLAGFACHIELEFANRHEMYAWQEMFPFAANASNSDVVKTYRAIRAILQLTGG